MSKNVCVIRHTTEFRGELSAAVTVVEQLREGETVEECTNRLLKDEGPYGDRFRDWLEIRLVRA